MILVKIFRLIIGGKALERMLEAIQNAKLRHVKEDEIKVTKSWNNETSEEKVTKATQLEQDCLVDIEKW